MNFQQELEERLKAQHEERCKPQPTRRTTFTVVRPAQDKEKKLCPDS
jgi:hypothetical protein